MTKTIIVKELIARTLYIYCHKTIWSCPITLALSENAGIGGRLGYFVWEDFVFQAHPIVIIKGA